MATANAGIKQELPDVGKRMSRDTNGRFMAPRDPMMYRKPEYYIHVFSMVDPREVPLMRDTTLLRKFAIPECRNGEEYVKVLDIPHPVNQEFDELDKWHVHYHDARKVAQDIVNPSNTTPNQFASINDPFTIGSDFSRLGVFWSENEVPTQDELDKVRARKEAYYRSRLNLMRQLESSNPKALYEAITIDDHVAADYFGEEYSWHKNAKRPAACPNCGEPIKEGIAFHKSDGVLCVIDWKRAVEAGVKTYEEVPPEKRWRKAGRSE